jgi:hypothetical protein
MNRISKNLYNINHFPGNGENRRIELSPIGLELCWMVANARFFGMLSHNAISALITLTNVSRFEWSQSGFSSDVINELTKSWCLANEGADFNPDAYQPWDRVDEVFINSIQSNESGAWFETNYYIEVALANFYRASKEVHNRIVNENPEIKYVPFLHHGQTELKRVEMI